MIRALISTAASIIIGWLLIDKVPLWLNMKGLIAMALKIIGVLIIISSLFSWV